MKVTLFRNKLFDTTSLNDYLLSVLENPYEVDKEDSWWESLYEEVLLKLHHIDIPEYVIEITYEKYYKSHPYDKKWFVEKELIEKYRKVLLRKYKL